MALYRVDVCPSINRLFEAVVSSEFSCSASCDMYTVVFTDVYSW